MITTKIERWTEDGIGETVIGSMSWIDVGTVIFLIMVMVWLFVMLAMINVDDQKDSR